MRIGVVSDTHSNLLAVEAVLADMDRVDALWCLGDFVGYGPWPNEVIAVQRDRGVSAIVGNHDLGAIGAISTADFNADAATMTEWTAQQLGAESAAYLKSLVPMREIHGVTLAHGTPREPVWEYLLSPAAALASFDCFATQLCLVGHTHIPTLFLEDSKGTAAGSYMAAGERHTLDRRRAIANPGSVGQPRDRDPRAAYLIYDSDQRTLEWRRVPYDIAAVQARMRGLRLPRFFIDRLEVGV
ncbi:MAG: metallophosphoesterase [Chloroflexi bacterium]|nr:metallophosphoesterase [Chloroflexota bacterium]